MYQYNDVPKTKKLTMLNVVSYATLLTIVLAINWRFSLFQIPLQLHHILLFLCVVYGLAYAYKQLLFDALIEEETKVIEENVERRHGIEKWKLEEQLRLAIEKIEDLKARNTELENNPNLAHVFQECEEKEHKIKELIHNREEWISHAKYLQTRIDDLDETIQEHQSRINEISVRYHNMKGALARVNRKRKNLKAQLNALH